MREPPSVESGISDPRETLLERLAFDRTGRPIALVRRVLFHANGKPRGILRQWVLDRDRRPRRPFVTWMRSEYYLSLPWPRSRTPPREAPVADIRLQDPSAHPLREQLLKRLDVLVRQVRP